jgi:murein DD-endopeptidase MepM/ murein hydrolase activator NlpD
MAQRQKELEAARKKNEYVGGEYLFPVPGYTIGSEDGSKFGMRMHPILKVQRRHNGVDSPAPTGTPIVAANSGTVIVVERHSSYGNYVVIDHGGGQATLYAHMSKFNKKVNATVKRGDTIGYVGSTGLSTGPHLHFEIIINGKPQDPGPYLRGR